MSVAAIDDDFERAKKDQYERLRRRVAEAVGSPIADTWTEADWFDYHSAVADIRRLSDLELRREVETSAYRLAFTDTDSETLALMRLREVPYAAALAVELRYRERVVREARVGPLQHSPQYEALGELLSRIDHEITLVDLIERETRFMVIPGKKESHSGCPNCDDGEDRLILWPGLPSWGFCRQCNWKPSVVGMAAFLWRLEARSLDHLREIAVRLGREYLAASSEAA